MRKSLRRVMLCALSCVLSCCILCCPDLSVASLAAADNTFTVDVSKSTYWLRQNVFAFAQNSSSVDVYSPSDGSVFDSDSNGARFFMNKVSDKNYTSSDIIYGFNLSAVIPWESSNANFSVSGTFDNSGYSDYNRPEKIGVFVMPVSDFNKFQLEYILDKEYVYFYDIPEVLYSAYKSGDSSAYKVYGAQVGTGQVFKFNFRVITPELSENLALVFVAYSGASPNFTFIPKTLTFKPYANSLSQMREWQHQQVIESQNNDLISQNGEIIGSDEEGSESGVKGLLKKLKELPESIAEKLKSLFVPTDEQVDDFKSNMSALLSDHLGAAYQCSSIFSDIIQQFIDFSPYQYSNCGDYVFKIPAFNFYVNPDTTQVFSDSDNGGSKFSLVPVADDGYYHVDFSFLDNKPYKQLYVVYKSFVTVFFVFLTLNFAKRKFDDIIGGNT